jgi:hypothetical protein
MTLPRRQAERNKGSGRHGTIGEGALKGLFNSGGGVREFDAGGCKDKRLRFLCGEGVAGGYFDLEIFVLYAAHGVLLY